MGYEYTKVYSVVPKPVPLFIWKLKKCNISMFKLDFRF